MSELKQDLEALARPRNNVEQALGLLDRGDQEAFLEALMEGLAGQVELARILTKHSGVTVGHKQLSNYKQKVRQGA